jgi:hypothetical protein
MHELLRGTLSPFIYLYYVYTAVDIFPASWQVGKWLKLQNKPLRISANWIPIWLEGHVTHHTVDHPSNLPETINSENSTPRYKLKQWIFHALVNVKTTDKDGDTNITGPYILDTSVVTITYRNVTCNNIAACQVIHKYSYRIIPKSK